MECIAQDHDELRQLAEQKEKEWKDISDKRIHSLATALKEQYQQCSNQATNLQKLKDDFKYNLSLIKERDQELEIYDLVCADLKKQLNMKNAEISELRIQMDDIKRAQDRELQSFGDLHAHYQERLKEKHADVEEFKISKNAEMYKERNEFECVRRSLRHQMTELEVDLERQGQELTNDFDSALKKREHEFRTQVDEMSAKVLEFDLKAQLLAKELVLVRKDNQVRFSQTECAEMSQHDLEKQLRNAQCQISHMSAINEAKINELSEKLKQNDKSKLKLQEDFQRKFSDMDRCLRENEDSAKRKQSAFREKEEGFVEKIHKLESLLGDSQVKIQQLQWTNGDLMANHAMSVDKLKTEKQELQGRCDKSLKEICHDVTSRDLQVRSMEKEISLLKADMACRRDDVDRYRTSLQQSVEREKLLERSKAQVELDWQCHCEELERRQYSKSEALIASLSQSKDQALAECKEIRRQLEGTTVQLQKAGECRNNDGTTMEKNSVNFAEDLQCDSHTREELKNLRNQNQSLRLALSSMRQMMESLGHSMPTAVLVPSDKNAKLCEPEFSQSLSGQQCLIDDVTKLDNICASATLLPKDSDHIIADVKDSNMRRHLQSLNNMLGVLRSEKLELTASIKKQQVRIQHLQESLEEAERQPRHLEVALEQQRYEMDTLHSRHAAESSAVKQRVKLLEAHLNETQKEADTFHQANIENNAELTSLRNQVSSLKMELAEKRPAINFGAQELMIKQLQDEVCNLRPLAGCAGTRCSDSIDQVGFNSAADLRGKLHRAARHITQLVRERQQLLELSNKLRSKLNIACAKEMPASVRQVSKVVIEDPCDQYNDRLAQLEGLQYELTKQELQYAQNVSSVKQIPSVSKDRDQVSKKARCMWLTGGISHGTNGLQVADRPIQTPSGHVSADVMSSVGSRSLLEVFGLVDGPESPNVDLDVLTTHLPKHSNNTSQCHGDTDKGILVCGQCVTTEKAKVTDPHNVLNRKAAITHSLKKTSSQRPKIRNYNVKADTGHI